MVRAVPPTVLLVCSRCSAPLLYQSTARPFVRNVPSHVTRSPHALTTAHGLVRWHAGDAPRTAVPLTAVMAETPHAVTVPGYAGWFENIARAMHATQPWRTLCPPGPAPTVHLCVPCYAQRRRLRAVFEALQYHNVRDVRASPVQRARAHGNSRVH